MPADTTDLPRRLHDDGVVVVPGLLDPTWCDRLHGAIERCRASPGTHYGVLSAPGTARVDSDLFRWFDDPDIAELTRSSPLPRLAAALLGSDEVVLVEDQWFCSEPGATTPSPWHQDDPYYNLDRPFVTIWITLDDIDEEAALRVVPGSHATGVLYAPVEFSATGVTIGGGVDPVRPMAPVPDIDGEPGAFTTTTWALRAGDAVAFDSRLLHATGRGRIDDRPFRRISTRWAHPDTRYLDRGPHVATFWDVLPHGLTDGDHIAGDVFPLVRPPAAVA